MSRLTCTFCAHRNPEGSSFCNQCGSPLHLAPCAHCEAINNLSDARCYACGAPLSRDEGEELAFAGMESAHGERESSSQPGPPGATLARGFEDLPWETPAPSRAREAGDDDRVPAPVVGAADLPPDIAREPGIAEEPAAAEGYRGRRAGYRKGGSRWPKRIVLGSALVAIAGAIGWSTLEIPQAWYRKLVAQPAAMLMRVLAPAPAPSPAVTPAQSSPPAVTPSAPAVTPAQSSARAMPPAQAPAQTEIAPVAPAPTNESASTSPPAEAGVPAPGDAPAPTPAAAAAPVRSDAPGQASERGAQPAPETAEPTSEARNRTPTPTTRTPTPATRTREQAMRDALATRRLIERDLGIAPRPNAGTP